MKLASWNVNGIRSICQKGFLEVLNSKTASIWCLQEIKSNQDQIPSDLSNLSLFQYYFPAQKKGYSGVGVISQIKPLKIDYGLNNPIFDDEGRCLILYYENFILINCYFPNGQEDHARVPYKLDFCQHISNLVKDLKNQHKIPVIITGDFNTAHQAIDLARPKNNLKTTGFLPIERAWIDDFIKMGMVDCFRHLSPELINDYTWWSYRFSAREKNIGWRIDYFFIDQNHSHLIKECRHLHQITGSDHCPVLLELKIY